MPIFGEAVLLELKKNMQVKEKTCFHVVVGFEPEKKTYSATGTSVHRGQSVILTKTASEPHDTAAANHHT